jgi:ribonuclease BN (tRNA processing enzyme)
MERLSVTCFGVGDGASCADRNHSSYLYQLDGTRILIDCGEPISRTYKAGGFNYDAVDGILLSHLHFDHLGGFFMLMQGFWLENRTRDLAVHLPARGADLVRQLLRGACLFEEVLSFKIHFHPLRDREPLEMKGVRVTPFLTTHLDGFRRQFEDRYPGNFEAYAFLMETERVRAVHSADLGSPQDLDALLARPVDLLVCELAHFQPEELFGYLRDADVKRIIFTHLARPYWERLEEIRRLAGAMLAGRDFAFCMDGDVISV